jgi:hypothetical protein
MTRSADGMWVLFYAVLVTTMTLAWAYIPT